MTVSWTRGQRQAARQQGLPLVTLAVDWTETEGGGLGKTEFSGPADEGVALAVEDLMRKVASQLQAQGRQGVSG